METEIFGDSTIEMGEKTRREVEERVAFLRSYVRSDALKQKVDTVKTWILSEQEAIYLTAWMTASFILYPNADDEEEAIFTMLAVSQAAAEICHMWRTQTKPN